MKELVHTGVVSGVWVPISRFLLFSLSPSFTSVFCFSVCQMVRNTKLDVTGKLFFFFCFILTNKYFPFLLYLPTPSLLLLFKDNFFLKTSEVESEDMKDS